MRVNGRNKDGRFAEGNSGGPGRPPVAKERQYVETLASVCTVDDWAKICQRAVKDAKTGDHRAREWLSKHLIGEPTAVAHVLHAHVHADADEQNPYANAPPEDLIAAMAALENLRESARRNECGDGLARLDGQQSLSTVS